MAAAAPQEMEVVAHTVVLTANALVDRLRGTVEDAVERGNELARQTSRLAEVYVRCCDAANVAMTSATTDQFYSWCLQLVQAPTGRGNLYVCHAAHTLGP